MDSAKETECGTAPPLSTTSQRRLAVVDGPETKHVIGLLTEQYALRRYSDELDRRRRELSGGE